MTFVQLEYVVAVDNFRHFARAAKECFVTQPTLSMQIHKLERELGTKIFDRNKQPVLPTESGIEIIRHARQILSQRDTMDDVIQSKKGIVSGELKLGIIPTLAPYLLPLFVQSFIRQYPQVKLIVHELTTDNILGRLKDGRIDAGLLVTPLQVNGIKEDILFYEELVAYVSRTNAAYKKNYVLAKDIDPSKLWLLEEGHCFRSQIVNLCELQKSSKEGTHFEYEAGSIETLRRMVDLNDGITIMPELATLDMTGRQQNHVRHFKHPAPVREISIVTHRDYVKRKLVEVLKKTILSVVPDKVKKNKTQNIVQV